MSTYNDLSLHVRLFMKSYPFSRYTIEPTPCARLAKPLGESRVALVTTAGLRTPDQGDFDRSNKRGDPSFREIPNTIETRLLMESHRSYSFDHEAVRSTSTWRFHSTASANSNRVA